MSTLRLCQSQHWSNETNTIESYCLINQYLFHQTDDIQFPNFFPAQTIHHSFTFQSQPAPPITWAQTWISKSHSYLSLESLWTSQSRSYPTFPSMAVYTLRLSLHLIRREYFHSTRPQHLQPRLPTSSSPLFPGRGKKYLPPPAVGLDLQDLDSPRCFLANRFLSLVNMSYIEGKANLPRWRLVQRRKNSRVWLHYQRCSSRSLLWWDADKEAILFESREQVLLECPEFRF